jgi:hypothetical protein
MKSPDQIKPNYGPVYAAAMYPELCKMFQKHGYALAVHGSLARDFDLIAVPWAEKASPLEEIFQEIEGFWAVKVLRDFERRNHGRIAFTFVCGWGNCAIDLSVVALPDGVLGSLAEKPNP